MKRIFAAVLAMLALCAVLAAPVSASEADRLATEWRVYAYLTEELKLNTAAACGVLANIEVESNFRLTALGDSGTSYGLCQWHAGRYTALRNYCAAQNLDYSSVFGQLAYLGFEMRTSYSGLLSQLQQVENTENGAYLAGYLWCTRFERPRDPELKGTIRGNKAQTKYWPRYKGIQMLYSEQTTNGFASELLNTSTRPISEPEYRPVFTPTATEPAETEPESTPAPVQPTAPAQAEKPSQAVHTPRRALFRAYVPRHKPAKETPILWESGILAGIPFQVLGDGQRRRWAELPLPEEEPEPEPV